MLNDFYETILNTCQKKSLKHPRDSHDSYRPSQLEYLPDASRGCELTHITMEIHVSSKNIILVFQSRSNRDENNCKGPKLLKVRDNNDQLCKEVDLLDSHIRDKRTACNLTADK